MLAQGLRTLLLADQEIAGAVVADGKGRIYPIVLPQGATLPAITYFTVSEVRPHSSPQGPLNLCAARVQIDVWAATYAGALALGNNVRRCLDGYQGNAGALQVQAIYADGGREFYEDEPKQWRVSRDYLVHFDESAS